MKYTHAGTDLPEENEYPKLVRDRIPEIIKQAEGWEVPTRILSDREFEDYLRRKVAEEATELLHAVDDANILEEIADIREVLDTLQRLKGIKEQDMNQIQDQKRAKRGGFDKRLLMLNNNE